MNPRRTRRLWLRSSLTLGLLSLLLAVFYLGRASAGRDWPSLVATALYVVAASIWYTVLARHYRTDREDYQAFLRTLDEEMRSRRTK